MVSINCTVPGPSSLIVDVAASSSKLLTGYLMEAHSGPPLAVDLRRPPDVPQLCIYGCCPSAPQAHSQQLGAWLQAEEEATVIRSTPSGWWKQLKVSQEEGNSRRRRRENPPTSTLMIAC